MKDEDASDEGKMQEVLKILSMEPDYEKLCYGRGKQDDITVVAAWVASREQPPPQ